MWRTLSLGAALVVVIVSMASAAVPPDPQCILNAQTERKNCKLECQDQYFTDVALCRNVDPACASQCQQQRTTCLAPLVVSLNQCVDQCDQQLQTDKGNCAGDQNCIDAAQAKAFVCRDTCRDNWRADPNIQAGVHFCRNQFRRCIQACPPPPTN
jgi:hypothetical protein